MTSDITKKLTDLESLYSEQEYTVITLNNIVSRQDQEISRLGEELKWVKQQLQSLKNQLPDNLGSLADELPPHY